MKNKQKESWEEELKLYLTSAGDRRRVIHFINTNFISKTVLREKIMEQIKGIQQVEYRAFPGLGQDIVKQLDQVLELLK